jgi:flavin reductase (DIM6/NTAB) family NADH-FMN oxidoreductase RutF
MQKPWNRVDQPVYSYATIGTTGANMNIATYVVPVSMKPKRILVAVYQNTKSFDNLEINPTFVLQYLAEEQANLVRLLGKQSGKKVNKMAKLEKRKLLEIWNGFPVLSDALAWVKLNVIERMNGGDHLCLLCDVVAYKNVREGNALTTRYLSEKNIISV